MLDPDWKLMGCFRSKNRNIMLQKCSCDLILVTCLTGFTSVKELTVEPSGKVWTAWSGPSQEQKQKHTDTVEKKANSSLRMDDTADGVTSSGDEDNWLKWGAKHTVHVKLEWASLSRQIMLRHIKCNPRTEEVNLLKMITNTRMRVTFQARYMSPIHCRLCVTCDWGLSI